VACSLRSLGRTPLCDLIANAKEYEPKGSDIENTRSFIQVKEHRDQNEKRHHKPIRGQSDTENPTWSIMMLSSAQRAETEADRRRLALMHLTLSSA
jgi:hypothetical protein